MQKSTLRAELGIVFVGTSDHGFCMFNQHTFKLMIVVERLTRCVYLEGHEFKQRVYLHHPRCLLKARSDRYAKCVFVSANVIAFPSRCD